MDYRQALAISRAGMDVEKLRLDVTALNLANLHTSSADPARRYQPRHVVAEVPFAQQFNAAAGTLPGQAIALPRARVEAGAAAPRQVYDPGHPDADARGFVSYPGVDHLHEMTTMNAALRAYQANVAAMNAAKAMARKALEIGGVQ